MSYKKLLLGVSEDRELFARKVYNEMFNNANANTHSRKSEEAYFLQLVEGNEELSEIEKRWCRERYIYYFELDNTTYKWGELRECDKCQTTRYSDKFCERCISLHLQSLFNTWTSGNEIIDDFIHKCQIQSSLPKSILEWIPFEEFENIEKLTEGGFSTIYTATWTRGTIVDYDENKKELSYYGPQLVVLKSLNNSNDPGKAFFNEVINYLS
jgi:hypothetical protein